MSHFCVFVLSETKPDQAALHEIMLPYHEYECTGYTEYLQDVDITDDLVVEFDRSCPVVVTADGKVYSRYDNLFYKDRTFQMPPDAHTAEMPADEARAIGIGYTDMANCAEEYFGDSCFEDAGRWYRKTNKNKKWDFWQVGGRWTGMLMPTYEPEQDPRNKETCSICNGTGQRNDQLGKEQRLADPTYTCNGCKGTGIEVKWPTEWAKISGDQTMLKDVPFEALHTTAEQKAAKHYDQVHAVIAGRTWESWDAIRERAEQAKTTGEAWDAVRRSYWDQPAVKDLQQNEELRLWDGIDDFLWVTRDDYLRRARDRIICPFAIVHNGQWHERGRVGWWACVSDEMPEGEWKAQVSVLLDSLPPTTWLTVVDAHI